MKRTPDARGASKERRIPCGKLFLLWFYLCDGQSWLRLPVVRARVERNPLQLLSSADEHELLPELSIL